MAQETLPVIEHHSQITPQLQLTYPTMAGCAVGTSASYSPSPATTSSTCSCTSYTSRTTPSIPSSATCTKSCTPHTSCTVFYPVPPALVPALPAPITPSVAPPPFFGQVNSPGGWALMPNYALALEQPYPIGYHLLCGLPTSSTMQGNRALVMRILKLPNLTSSLVGTH